MRACPSARQPLRHRPKHPRPKNPVPQFSAPGEGSEDSRRAKSLLLPLPPRTHVREAFPPLPPSARPATRAHDAALRVSWLVASVFGGAAGKEGYGLWGCEGPSWMGGRELKRAGGPGRVSNHWRTEGLLAVRCGAADRARRRGRASVPWPGSDGKVLCVVRRRERPVLEGGRAGTAATVPLTTDRCSPCADSTPTLADTMARTAVHYPPPAILPGWLASGKGGGGVVDRVRLRGRSILPSSLAEKSRRSKQRP